MRRKCHPIVTPLHFSHWEDRDGSSSRQPEYAFAWPALRMHLVSCYKHAWDTEGAGSSDSRVKEAGGT